MIDNTRVHRTMRNTPVRRSKKRGTPLTAQERANALLASQDNLRVALKAAKDADAPMLAGRIRAALKSCDGAIRHADRADIRAQRQEMAEYHKARRLEEASDREYLVIRGDTVDGPIKAGP